MTRKWLIAWALALVLCLLLPCAVAEETFDMQEFYDVNTFDKLCPNPGDSMSDVTVRKDADGTFQFAYYAQIDEKGELTCIYVEDGYLQNCKDGLGYSYDTASEPQAYIECFMEEDYTEIIDNIRNNLPFTKEEDDAEFIQSVERDGDLLIVTIVPDAAPEVFRDLGAQSAESILTVDAETLLIQQYDYKLLDGDGNVIYSSSSVYKVGDPYTIDESIAAQWTSEETHTLTVVMDPGTEQEQKQTFVLPQKVECRVFMPEDYTCYEDAECTAPLEAFGRNADGSYPDELTVYIAPEK